MLRIFDEKLCSPPNGVPVQRHRLSPDLLFEFSNVFEISMLTT
jgi:hypothetical protein